MALTYQTQTIRNTSVLTKTLDVPTDSSTVTFVFLSAIRSATSNREFEYTSVTLGGASMTLVDDHEENSTNRWYLYALYRMDDPYGTLSTTTPQLSVTTSRGIAGMNAIAVHATGTTAVGTVMNEAMVSSASEDFVSLDYTSTQLPSTILTFGWVRYREGVGDNYTSFTPSGDNTQLVKIQSGDNDFNDIVSGAGYHEAVSIDTYSLGWTWDTQDNYGMFAIEVIGQFAVAEAEFTAIEPTVTFGSASLDDLVATAAFTASFGSISIGSQPPVQVIGAGNLYFTTSARRLSTILLSTTGEYWTIATTAPATEDLGVSIVRRRGYLIPR